MKKVQPVFAFVLLLAVQSLCALPGAETPASTVTPGPGVTGIPGDESVGTINLVISQVQTGPPENLQYLEGIQNFHNGDGVRVTEGGKGKLALNDGTQMTLFNETEVSGINVSTSPYRTDLFLQSQGFLGYVPPGGRTTVNMPNGAKVTILGTLFFVLHNETTQVATAGNFDGTVTYTPPGGTEQILQQRSMVQIPAEGEVIFMDLPFTPEQFEAAVDQYGTPTTGLDVLMREYRLPLPPEGGETVPVTEPPVSRTGWSAWQQLDGEIKDAPAVASWGVGRLDVFARGMDDALWHKYWVPSGWSAWEYLGGVLTSSPAAASWGENRIDIFALGTDSQVWQFVWDNAWFGWYPQGGGEVEFGGQPEDAPAVSTWSVNQLDLFVRRSDHNLVYKLWDGSTWSDWITLGNQIYSAPSAVSRNADLIDIVARGESGQVLWRNALGDWVSFDGRIQGAPAITSWGTDRMDLFARAEDNSLLHSSWDPSTSWSDWENLGGPIYSSPAAVSWGPGRIDVFARGEAGNLIHISYQE